MNRVRWRKRLILAVKVVVAVAVVWGVGRHVLRTWSDLKRHELVLQVSPAYLAVSGLLYLVGLTLCALFYDDVLKASPTPIPRLAAVRAYLISHLGKYVPGKAMVVVMRAGMSAQHGARGATAAIATFYETLVMMASGGLIAAAGFAMGGPSPLATVNLPVLGATSIPVFQLASLGSLGLGLGFLVVVWPSVFRRIALVASLPIPGAGPDALPRFTKRLMALGLARASLSWLALGLSQLAVVRGLTPWGYRELLATYPLVVASVALATVAGFVIAVFPGGLGVREGVLMYALGPALGVDLAVVAALVLRLVWVAAEFVAALAVGPLGSRGDVPPNPLPQPSTSGSS
ncbi:MAG: lysylphosphatidylglycerol synthase domain-containing protein [Paludisphaera borealis]|uniref:lysylphosphatidylglycerol synthase domain-containing protein n=1 Tax=Paludisphaera borealis TaxID=1387353 RepID=UPI00283B0E1B|nr:lysylphosphatidylglycerol synthase domain-containing protein [Paludisphaera borealis]MDR3620704.1 lysylphosphatidylglycerol synthase domain-containing protein [Paludisphaera borealis]